MKTYKDFVEKYSRLMKEGRSIPCGTFSASYKPHVGEEALKAILFSPHPDDESIIGALPLRLMREMKMSIINVPITYGSNLERQKERYQELIGACNYLGFKILQIQENGLQNVKKIVKTTQPDTWKLIVNKIADIIRNERPRIIFIPHNEEFNATHAGTHELVLDSLGLQEVDFNCQVVEWEYWTPIKKPNLLVEVSKDLLAEIITAVSFHVGEVKRNPQHVNLPAWMQDNVRRGSELIGAQGGIAPQFEFATIYRLLQYEKGKFIEFEEGRFLSSKDKLTDLFQART